MPQFFDLEQEISKINLEQRLRLFATDVLHTEIRFKRCERHHDLYVDLDDDLNFVSWMVPSLLGGISQLDNDFTESAYEKDWIKIKARIFWLCAGVFLWRSRFTATAFESIEAEEEGLRYIESTISCLDLPINSPIQVIPTPHLESPGRVGAHWKKLSHQSLAAYRDEIQASSVVSLAQQQFQERIATITKRNKDTDEISLTNEDIKDLSLIGDSLIARYKVPFGEKGCKLNELLDDFLSLFGDEYFSKSLNKGKELSRDQVVPSIIQVRKLAESSDLSILTILVACLRTKPENHGRISMLLIHLVLTSLDRHEQVCFSGQAGNGGDASPTEDLSDSEDDSMSDEGRVQGTGAGTMGYAITAMKCGRFAKFIIDCLRDSLISLEDDEKVKVSLSDAFVRMLHHSLAFCSNWVDHFSQQPAVIEECLDLDTFISIQKLLKSLPGPEAANDENSYLQQLYFRGLVRIICSQRRSFSSLVRVQGTVRARRAVRQRICIARARFIGTVFCDMGCLLSQNLSTIGTASMRRSTMVEISLSDALNSDSDVNWPIDLPRLCDALLWFWEYAGMSTSQLDASTGTSFDRPIIERLRIPLAAAILGFCGSASCTRKTMKTTPKRGAGIDDDDEPSDHLCLTEFFDSDASAREFSDSEEETEGNVTTEVVSSQRELLRAISHVIHCVGLVFGKMEEKEIVSFDRCDLYKTKHGPLLPLVASRILNHLADAILEHFRDDDDRDDNGIWSDSYPFATRSIGALLDSALYKAYKCLHGFTLTGSTDQHSIKDSILPTNADIEIDRFLPESTAAAARLYRCIIRARRRTPPSAALETVLAALPNLEMSEKTKKIHDFLFSTTSSRFNEEEIKMIVTKSSRWENLFEVVQEWELAANSSDVNNADHDLEDSSNDEVMRVRKGIFALLAQGDLPTYASSQGAKDDERSSAARFENELTKKFDAILKDLSYGDTTNIRSWLRAAQCCMLKAEAICDRLGMSKGFARSKGFHIPEEHPAHVSRQDIATLETKQEQEDEMRKLGCLDQIGDDLSLYIQHKWSNFDSLELLSEKLIGGAEASMDISVSQDEGGVFEHQVKKDISDMQKKGRLVEWQQAWGGMFVSALKKIAVRCMCLAFYFYHEHFEGMTTEDQGLLRKSHIIQCLIVSAEINS